MEEDKIKIGSNSTYVEIKKKSTVHAKSYGTLFDFLQKWINKISCGHIASLRLLSHENNNPEKKFDAVP